MPKQLELLKKERFHLEPHAGHDEPRLWIRRLVIWSEPGTIRRSLDFRPGLNVIWSPDILDQPKRKNAQSTLGHGSGKTLLCRLLRYCLGEDRFANDELRQSIARVFPKGSVGAEVILNKVPWAILRPIGTGRQHFAIPDMNLDELVSSKIEPTGMAPFLEALASGILSEDVVPHLPGDRPFHAWLVALAWLSRDQESRLGHVLDWRSADSDSDSPVRALSRIDILDALRLLIGAIDPEEVKIREAIIEQETEQKKEFQEAGHLQWQSDRLRSRLATDLDVSPETLSPGRLAVEPLRKTAKAKLSQLAANESNSALSEADLETLHEESEKAQKRLQKIEKALAEAEARIPEIERQISMIKGEIPALAFTVFKSGNPQCPICEIPIDRILAEGCKLSHKLPDSEELRKQWAASEKELESEKLRLAQQKKQKDDQQKELVSTKGIADDLSKRLRAAEKDHNARTDAWYKARRLIEDVDRLEEILTVQEKKLLSAERIANAIEKNRQKTKAFRDAQSTVIRQLSKHFDAIVREFIGSDANGKITLDGNGLGLSIKMGGERSTTAMAALKIIAFDLAVMCMSIEGNTHLPAFLIHDSPREADLGLSVYQQLFNFAVELEKIGNQPSFQYIVTTTTRPPEELLQKPWLRKTIGGLPAEARLLKRDL